VVVVANEHFLAATHIKIKDVRRAAGVTTRQFCGFLLYFGIGQNIRKWGVAMLEKIFSFGKAKEKQSDDTTGKCRTITEEEYQRYVFEDELFKIIVETEAALHNIEDPVEIAVGVMKAACKFYGADWCGILIADLRSQLWRPEMWYDVETGPMKETLFHEFEMTEEFVTWAEHLVSQKPMIIPDTEAIRESNPKEYEAYQRLKAKAVIGVPFGQHPLGYIPAYITSHIIYRLASDEAPTREAFKKYVCEAMQMADEKYSSQVDALQTLHTLIDLALSLADQDIPDHKAIKDIGEGWVAEETLAIALYCVAKHFDNFEQALIASVNHGGDSDSTGAVTGNILGAAIGYEAIPQYFKNDLELHDVILHIADDLWLGEITKC
jgi:hypothetical protein